MVKTVSRAVFGQLAEIVLEGGAKKATKYLSPYLTVKAIHRGRRTKRDTRHELLFTVGAPNYKERAFIKACKSAGEKFPVRKPQVVWYKPHGKGQNPAEVPA